MFLVDSPWVDAAFLPDVSICLSFGIFRPFTFNIWWAGLGLLSSYLFSTDPICFSPFPLFLPSFGWIQCVFTISLCLCVGLFALALWFVFTVVLRFRAGIFNLSESTFKWYYTPSCTIHHDSRIFSLLPPKFVLLFHAFCLRVCHQRHCT